MTAFDDFGLAPALLQAVRDLGFERPTPVQGKVIPAFLKNSRDLVALAQTGTGKTAAYGLPLLQMTDPASAATQAVILCPTRELCLQIAKDLSAFSKHQRGVRILAVYGGASIDTQLRALHRGVHIIVATPGRLSDVLRRKRADLSQVRWAVLDEADEMMSMGFQEELEAILAEVPDAARTLLFSATMPRAVAAMASKYMDDPEEILVGQRNAGSDTVRHECYVVHARDRYPALKRIIDNQPSIYGIIFCRTRAETQEVAAHLAADGYNADALHGDLTQVQRDRVMHAFRIRKLQLLVATDVAARGLDVNDLTHVINYNLPDDADVYTHRSGRTGRAGKEGVSVVIANAREEYRLRSLESVVRKRFTHKSVPSGRDVCMAQLQGLLERIKAIPVDEGQLGPYLPAIDDALAGMTREELARRLVGREFNRFLDYYKDAPDLNVKAPERRGRHERGDGDTRPARPERQGGGSRRDERPSGPVSRLLINIGRRNGVTPPVLMTLINRATRGPMLPIGRIEVMDQSSMVEVYAEDTRDLMQTLNQMRFENRQVRVMPMGRLYEGRGPRDAGGHRQRPPFRGATTGHGGGPRGRPPL